MKLDTLVVAECTLRKKFKNGTKLASFTATIDFEDQYTNLVNKILTQDQSLEVSWTLKSLIGESFDFHTFYLRNHNKNIYGNFVIRTNSSKVTGTFETSDSELTQLLINTNRPVRSIKVVIDVYYDEEKFERAASVTEDYDKFFLTNHQSSDVIFVCGDQEIPAHRQIVAARNEVLAKMFESDMTETKTGRIEITDIEPGILKILLRFIYSGKLDVVLSTDDLLKLIVAADKYSVLSLVRICENSLLDKLSVKNAVKMMVVADLVRVDFLKMKCSELIVRNRVELSRTQEFRDVIVKAGRADLLYELFCRTIPKHPWVYKVLFMVFMFFMIFSFFMIWAYHHFYDYFTNKKYPETLWSILYSKIQMSICVRK